MSVGQRKAPHFPQGASSKRRSKTDDNSSGDEAITTPSSLSSPQPKRAYYRPYCGELDDFIATNETAHKVYIVGIEDGFTSGHESGFEAGLREAERRTKRLIGEATLRGEIPVHPLIERSVQRFLGDWNREEADQRHRERFWDNYRAQINGGGEAK